MPAPTRIGSLHNSLLSHRQNRQRCKQGADDMVDPIADQIRENTISIDTTAVRHRQGKKRKKGNAAHDGPLPWLESGKDLAAGHTPATRTATWVPKSRSNYHQDQTSGGPTCQRTALASAP